MQDGVARGRENKALDVFKFLACVLVVGSHMPQLFVWGTLDLYYRQWLFRFCVPFFFLSSGYFFQKTEKKEKILRRIALLFAAGYVLYLPYILKTNPDSGLLSRLAWNAVFGYEHLWYISATLEGMLVWYIAERLPLVSTLFRKLGLPAAVLLLFIGALTDEYYPLLDIGPVTALSKFLLNFGGPRNVVFFGFPMLMIGGALARQEDKLSRIPTWALTAGLLICWGVSFVECSVLLAKLGTEITNDITLFNFWPAIFLFLLSFRINVNISEAFAKTLRKMAEHVYILHWLAADMIGRYLYLMGIPRWILTMLLCSAVSLLLIWLRKSKHKA